MRSDCQNRQRQRGDTIVEVLISITIIAVVLAGAYVTTNRSLQNTRSAQERTNALKLTESQIEQIKGAISADATGFFANSITNASFCMSGATPVATSDAACVQDTTGAATSVEPKFNLSITKSGNLFVVTNTWSNINGRSTDKLIIPYRVYP